MKKPENYRELLKLVNPEDLLHAFDFSGKNDKPNSKHWKLKRKFSKLIWESIKDYRKKEPRNTIGGLCDNFYTTLIECMQDFYYWSRGFAHSHAHIFQRIQNALEIPIEDISIFRR